MRMGAVMIADGETALDGSFRLRRARFAFVHDQTGKLTPNDPPFISASSKGAGPRHFVFTPKGDALWLINEEASTLTHYALDSNGRLKEGKTVSALPDCLSSVRVRG